MKTSGGIIALLLCLSSLTTAEVTVDEAAYGKSLGGWVKRSKKYADYEVSGVTYRTYRPEVSPTPDGGIYVTVRIDHLRGVFSSDDHAMLELTIDKGGVISSAKSSIAIQGRSISSDVIEGVNQAGSHTSVDRAVQIGADLVANLSAKLLRTKLVEAGRVGFPSAVRHNYNLLYQSIRVLPEVPVAQPVVSVPNEATVVMPEPQVEARVDDQDESHEDVLKPASLGEQSAPLSIEGFRQTSSLEMDKAKEVEESAR